MGAPRSSSANGQKVKTEKGFDELRIESLHCYSIDIQTRRVYLMEEIEGDTCSQIAKDIHYLESKNPAAPIQVYINSPGGSVDQMFFIYDTLKNCSCPIVTIGTGGIYSAAGLLLVSGDLRIATQHSFFMSHQTQNLIVGADNEIEAQVIIGRKMKDMFWNIMGECSSIPAKTWQRNATNKGEIWYTAEEMLKHKIVDHILSPKERLEDIIKKMLPKHKGA